MGDWVFGLVRKAGAFVSASMLLMYHWCTDSLFAASSAQGAVQTANHWLRQPLFITVVVAALFLAGGLVYFLFVRFDGPCASVIHLCDPKPMDTDAGVRTEFDSTFDWSGARYTVKLSNEKQPGETWTLPLGDEAVIGRAEHCDVALDDQRVSREHCKIVTRGGGVAVVHLSKTNKTLLNGNIVSESAALRSGDMIRIGHISLHVDYIQLLGEILEAPPLKSMEKGQTQSIF